MLVRVQKGPGTSGVGLSVAARTARELPAGRRGWAFEPKLDGWRALCFAEAGVVQSRHGTDLFRRFPEVVAAVRSQCGDVVVDGELVAYQDGRLSFAALGYGPARRRVERVSLFYVLFDLLAVGEQDVRAEPYAARRERLEQSLGEPVPPLQLVHSTTDRDTAVEWMSTELATVGIEGVVAKPADSRYHSGQRRDWLKIRHTILVDAHAIGVLGTLAHPTALVLAAPGSQHVIGVSSSLPRLLQGEVVARARATGPRRELPPIVGGLPRANAPPISYQPIQAVAVVLETDAAFEHGRLRHRPRVVRVVSLVK